MQETAKLKRFGLALLILMVDSLIIFVLCDPADSSTQAQCKLIYNLFTIEHSKNGNIVYYDICIGDDEYPSETDAVIVYWKMENGRKEKLTKLERKFGYGIKKLTRLEKGIFRITLASTKDRFITVKKIGEMYRATIMINGVESLFEKAYIKSHEAVAGLPHVDFVDLFGKTMTEGRSVRERIVHSKHH